MKNNRAETINVALGGKACRNAIKTLPMQGPGSIAHIGGAAIKMHFTSDGQALSVYDKDDITQTIMKHLVDITVDSVSNPNIHVIYDNHQVYPEYIIELNSNVIDSNSNNAGFGSITGEQGCSPMLAKNKLV